MEDFGINERTPGDVDGDGNVDNADRGALNHALGLCAEDFTGDGRADEFDMGLFLAAWGVCSVP